MLDGDACVACSSGAFGNLPSDSTCGDVKSALCDNFVNCASTCAVQDDGACGSESTDLFVCTISLTLGPGNCGAVQCDGSTSDEESGGGTSSAGSYHFMGLAAAVVPALLIGGLGI